MCVSVCACVCVCMYVYVFMFVIFAALKCILHLHKQAHAIQYNSLFTTSSAENIKFLNKISTDTLKKTMTAGQRA